jgi:hypothetical protein
MEVAERDTGTQRREQQRQRDDGETAQGHLRFVVDLQV